MATTLDNCSRIRNNDCTVICKGPKPVPCQTCRNMPGGEGVECVCPEGYKGDGRRNGTGCTSIESDDNGTQKLLIQVGFVIAVLAIVVALVLLYKWLKKRRRNDPRRTLSIVLGFDKLPDFTKFTHSELSEATDDFDKSNIIGQGAQGTVYRGFLRGHKVAIKKCILLDTQVGESKKADTTDKYKEFGNEARLLGDLRHENIVRVLGYTLEPGQAFLVYELVENGTLHDRLHVEVGTIMTWHTRVEIALGVAAAIKHLHYDTPDGRIIHRDIKTTNILLDDDVPKLADFGVSRWIPEGATHVNTTSKGTPGYMAPENYNCPEQRVMGDIFSFGVVLGELLTRKRWMFIDDESGQGRFLHQYLISLDSDQTMLQALDQELLHDASDRTKKNIVLALKLAKRCCNITASVRPRMKQVVEELSKMRATKDDLTLTAAEQLASTSVAGILKAMSESTSTVTGSVK